ncbi:hypothetical protein Trydic_g16532 [Trypoxylus dichotomus]
MGLIISQVDVGYIRKTVVSNDVLFLVLCKIVGTMSVIDTANVLYMLLVTFQLVNIAVIPLRPQESELNDALQNIIVAAQRKGMFAFEDVTELWFDELAEVHDG